MRNVLRKRASINAFSIVLQAFANAHAKLHIVLEKDEKDRAVAVLHLFLAAPIVGVEGFAGSGARGVRSPAVT
jgi:hypothetical protein